MQIFTYLNQLILLKRDFTSHLFIRNYGSFLNTTKHFSSVKSIFILMLIGFSISHHGLAQEKFNKSDSLKWNYYELQNTTAAKHWVDSLFTSLTPQQRLAQMIMVAAYYTGEKVNAEKIASIIKENNLGGVIFFSGGPVRQLNYTNYYQSLAKTPLLIGIDAEWGLAMRLDSTMKYPKQMSLGAIQDDSLIYAMGKDIADQCHRMGIHITFAPDVDVNNNPANPVINSRSFGESREKVCRKAYYYMKGLQDNKILAVAKHFPGHGDTDSDSHISLPVIKHSVSRLDSIELFPFKSIIHDGVAGVMVGHLNVPALDSTPNIASTLSFKIVNRLLRNSMHFNGLIFTDALNMKGVSKIYKSGKIETEAVKAGNDIILMPDDVSAALDAISKAIASGEISQARIDSSCRRILFAKYWAGLYKYRPCDTSHLNEDLNSTQSILLKKKLVTASLTLLSNKDSILPFKNLDRRSIAAIIIGNGYGKAFANALSLYAPVKSFFVPKDSSFAYYTHYIDSLKNYNTVIAAIVNTDMRASMTFGIKPQAVKLLDSITSVKPVVLALFANPYSIKWFKNSDQMKALLVAYEDNDVAQVAAAEVLFGGNTCNGRLPVQACSLFPINAGITLQNKIRMHYGMPEEIGLSSSKFQLIDSIVYDAISKKSMPGCQVLVSIKGNVIYHKAFGYHTYSNEKKVELSDLYDIASVTKISASVPSLMRLYEQGSIDLQQKLSHYMPELKHTNKKDMLLVDMLTHQAGLEPWIPFYLSTIRPLNSGETLFSKTADQIHPYKFAANTFVNKNVIYRDSLYSKVFSSRYSVPVADSLYILKTYKDSIYEKINQSEVQKKKEYKYSDLGYFYYQKIIESITHTRLDSLVAASFYKPLGATTTGYLPLKNFPKSQIVPTENDLVFRKQLIQGYVHDPAAAMLGGVAGHAGIFSDANDLAKLMQMYLQYGEYGGVRYFKKETIEYFTSSPFIDKGNRRALGFDKPEMNYNKIGPTCKCVSAKSFGHTGFTGTYAWVDPETQVVYIFLSNRVHPDQNSSKLVDLNVRTKIQEVIADALKTSVQ
jgi:beta-N-acetylhexosaminidase